MKKALLFIFIFTQTAFSYLPAITNFNTGQAGHLLESRIDFQNYNSSCRLLENMLVTVQGPAVKRPGTKYIATANGENRLIPFEYSTDDTYILEFGDSYIRFYRNGAQILDANDDPYEITTVFDSDEIWDIQYAQSDNIMYIVDGNDTSQMLSRSSHTDWTISDCNFTTGPFMPENTDTDVNITPSDVTGSITLEASDDIFYSGHEGSIWQLNQRRDSSVYRGTIDANESSSSTAYFVGSYSFTTDGTWVGTITLERSTDGGSSWESALASLTDTNFDNPAETEEDGAVYRVTGSAWTSGSCEYTITITDQYNHGIVRIDTYTDANTVTATVLTDLVDTDATSQWREGYWSDYRGWPKTVEFHQQRLVFGGSDSFPQNVWFGKTDPDDYLNFTEGTLDTSSFTAALPGQNPIRWLLSQDYLLIGTAGSVGKYGEQGKSITPTSPKYQSQSRHGSAAIKSVLAGDMVLYVERGNMKIRSFAYDLQYDKYTSSDIMFLSPEITDSGIKDIAFQLRPNPILWCVLNDGNMATLTYQYGQNVVAWTRQITDGDFESVAVIPNTTGEDEVWVTVKRTISDSNVRYIEQFQPIDWGDDANDCWFVDSGLSYSGSATEEFNGIDHLEGESISIWADGTVQANETVSSGAFSLDISASDCVAGLPFTAKLETMPIVIDPQVMSSNKKIKALYVDFYKTGYVKFGNGQNSNLTEVAFYDGATLTARHDLYTSVVSLKRFPFVYGSMKKQTIYFESDKPAPLCIRAIAPDIEITGN